MLVLTRKVGEGISIGDDIKIVVMQIKGKQVRLGIKAPPNTIVHREEIYEKILQENVMASTAPVAAIDQASKLAKSTLDQSTGNGFKIKAKGVKSDE